VELAQRIRTSRGVIAFDVLGEGPDVVLVHGTPSRAAAWRDVAAGLAADHRVFVYDLLGFGASERHVEQDVSVDVHGKVLAELLDAWRLEAPAVVGHDIGGATALRAHLVEGAPVSRLALVDAVVLRPWLTPRSRQMQRDTARYASLPDPRLAGVIEDHLRTATAAPLDDERYRSLFAQWDGAEGQALYLRNIRCLDERDTEPVEERLSTVAVPTAVIWGAADAWLPAELSHRIAARIGAPPPTVIPDAGHFCMLDQPQAVTDALRAFLSDTRAAAA
jgi:pimeloyl-ACP methyl ester carboxylesterase